MKYLALVSLLYTLHLLNLANAAEVKMVVRPFEVDITPGERIDTEFVSTPFEVGNELEVECFWFPSYDRDEGYELSSSGKLLISKYPGEERYQVKLDRRLVVKSFLTGRKFDHCTATVWLKRRDFDDIRYDNIIIDAVWTEKRHRDLTKQVIDAIKTYHPRLPN